ncbi:MAG: protein kinase [Actinomycetota bacterium]|nr:protein kinase [Actinomycetota bacterium]
MSTILGTTLNGRYRLEARVGSGGMSTVYRALDETLQRQVAIKLMNREIASDFDQLERFRREARAVAQLSHPHIVGVIDAGEDDGRPYIVFEYVEGETLKERIRRLGRLPIAEAVAYAIEIARALGAAHARHIVHRDVKPQNVMIDEEGQAKVTDFGIARMRDEEGLTADGRVLGTTDYVSPEQALGQPVTGQSDLYSLGIVLYEMLTGEVPFKGENQVAVAMKHVREQIPDVRSKRPEVSAALAAVLETATAKHLEDRYGDDAELIADLEDVLAIEAARAGSATGQVTSVLRTLPSGKQRRVPFRVRHPFLSAALLGAALALLGGGAYWLATTRVHNGTPKLSAPPPKPTLKQVTVCDTCAHDYNPDALSGPKSQNPNLVGYAIDGNPNTAWETQHYYSGTLGKPGVGVYLDAKPGIAAAEIRINTQSPGWKAEVYATNTQPDPQAFTGWTLAGSAPAVHSTENIPLRTRGTHYRWYLVWITSLPPSQQTVFLNEIALYAYK